MNINKYDTIILDCDGVVFDSNLLKIKAFEKTLLELKFDKEKVERFTKYFKNNFGLSRYKFVEYFIKDILKIDFDEKLYNQILQNYSKKAFELYLETDFTKNLIQFLEHYKSKNLFIASGSDEKELKEVFKIRKIDNYFKDVFGSPKKKSEIIKDIVKNHLNSVMIGDAMSDMIAAKEAKIDFIFMRDYSTNEELKNKDDLVTISNLGDLI